MYVAFNVNLLGMKVLNAGFLIVEEPIWILDKKCHTKLPWILGWNMIQLVYNVSVEKYGFNIFNSFICLRAFNQLLFSKHCLFHYAEVFKDHSLGVQPIYHQTDSGNDSTPIKLPHLAKKKRSPTTFH